jgi:hypothetical protein
MSSLYMRDAFEALRRKAGRRDEYEAESPLTDIR